MDLERSFSGVVEETKRLHRVSKLGLSTDKQCFQCGPPNVGILLTDVLESFFESFGQDVLNLLLN